MEATALAPSAASVGDPSHVPATPLARLAAMPTRNKISLGVGIVVLIALLVAAFSWPRDPEYRVLYTNVSDKEGGSIIAALSQLNVPYRYTAGGTAIMVPEDRVHDTRLKLASQGLPRGGAVGFELLENQKFGTTQFQERLNFQRGLEGELARSIMSLGSVQGARVHLALPASNGFLREQQKPSASILVTLHPGRTLDRAQVDGIVHLVAASVPQLSPRQVSVIDQTGMLLSASGDNAAGNSMGMNASQMAHVRRVEAELSQRVVAILEPIVGSGNVRAQVAADIDFTQSESTAEQYRPNQGQEPAAVRSQQMVDDKTLGAGAGPQGIPGAMTNQPPQPAAAPVNGPAQVTQAAGRPPVGAAGAAAAGAAGAELPGRRESLTNYEVDKTILVTRSPTATVKRLSAAIVVNHRRNVDAEGKVTQVALAPEEIESIQALVREAIGLNKDRGDSINVVNAPFTETEHNDTADVPLWKQPEAVAIARDFGKQIALIVIALMVLLFLVRPALKTLRPEPVPRLSHSVDDVLALPGMENATPEERAEAVANIQMEQLLKIGRDDPATVANVLREWIGIENKEA